MKMVFMQLINHWSFKLSFQEQIKAETVPYQLHNLTVGCILSHSNNQLNAHIKCSPLVKLLWACFLVLVLFPVCCQFFYDWFSFAPDDIFDEKPQKRSRSSSKRGSWATSRRPSEDVIHRASSKSGIAEEATEDELNESTSRRHSLHQDNETDDKESKTTSTAPSHGVDSFDHLNTTADRSIKNASQSLSMGSPSKEVTRKLTQSIRRRQSFDAALNGLKTRPRVDVHRRSSQREVVFNTDPLKRREFSESERQSFSQSGSQTPQQQRMPLGAGLVTGSTTGRRESYHNDRRVKKSPLIQSTRMSRALSATEVN